MNKAILSVLGVFCVFSMVSCTSRELKQRAEADAKTMYVETLEKEIEGVVMPGRLRDNYISFLKATAKFEAESPKMASDTQATVVVQVEAVAKENRKTLAEIASSVEENKAIKFNMGNAINLIEQQPGQVRGKIVYLYSLRYRKEGPRWILEKPN